MKTIFTAALVAVSLTGCGVATVPGIAARGSLAPAPKTQAPSDPMSTNGTWMVPSEIPPGNYRTQMQPGETGGYSEVCADVACEIGTPGFISNDLYDGPGMLSIPENAVAVKIRDIVLTPMVG